MSRIERKLRRAAERKGERRVTITQEQANRLANLHTFIEQAQLRFNDSVAMVLAQAGIEKADLVSITGDDPPVLILKNVVVSNGKPSHVT